jgi:hypothetical protein
MTLANVSFCLFTFFNALRVLSYLPQLIRVAQDNSGASVVSYSTWALWTLANSTTSLHAYVNLQDQTLTLVNALNAVCCAAVIALTLIKRCKYRTMAGLAAGSGPGVSS